MDKIKPLINYLSKYFQEKSNSFYLILDNYKDDLCTKIYLAICTIIIYFVALFILIQAIVIASIFIYYKTTLYLRVNTSLYNDPSFTQIDNFVHITNYICFERNMLTSVILIIFFVIALFYLKYKVTVPNVITEWSYINMFIFICFVLIFFYFIIFYKTINKIANKNFNMLNMIYNNINKEYLTKAPICNYFNNADNDIDFEYGKCNNFNNLNDIMLIDYIEVQTTQISKYIDITADLSKESFKNIKDENGISYYDKILSAIITHAVVTYYKGLKYQDGKDFFSIHNILNTNYIEELFKHRINPFLDITITDINLLQYILQDQICYDENINGSYIISYIRRDYETIKDKITNSIIDFININKTITPAAYTYILIVFVAIILFIIRFIQHV